ncbi:hypothetical protein Mal15_10540 [Stieleria maiorica]|uniref:DUF4347 domain-containing protein n=1 Tax=Stieleria maiorica TaxID=2795974 RepID=A0A5B9MBQ8_9BACT|nr:DUF4347 domain-containing protein [Stieleria maiorica]QEF97024.1 hypothetical protein Mal15_10540 [Stieleria maiorica]
MPWRRRKRKHDSSSILRGGHLLDAAVLEKRLLFSATPIAPPVDHVDADPETQQPFPDGATAADATTHSGQGDPTQDDQQRQRRLEVAFVDASIGDYQPLVDALRSESGNADLEIYLLEGSRDGIEQIGEILSAYNHSAYNDIDAVHLLTDGADGQLRLGSSLVNAGNLDGSAGDFAAWGSSLSQDADLILHGFQSSQSPESRTMLEAISELTGATVAVPTSDAVRAESVAADSSADVASADEQHTSREIVLVDQTAEDYQQLLADLQSERGDGRSFEVILLDGHSDGIDQISRALAQYDDVDAIHLVTHGTAGRLKLGNTWLSLDNLNEHADAIALWGDSLGDGADLLIYGCDLAADEDGRTLSTSLASLTGADVAASDDNTGYAIFGGDWDLEYSTGAIETSLAFSLDVQQNWAHLLNVTIDNTTTDTAGTGAASTSFAHATAGTDRLMLVGISFGQDMGDVVSSVTYNGVSLTLVGTQEHADPSKSRVEIWSLVAPDVGTHNIVVNFSGTNHQGATVGVMTFTDVDQTTPVGTFTGDQGTSGTPSVTVSSTNNDLVFGVVGVDDNSDWDFTPGSGQTEHWDLFSSQANGSGTTEDGAASVVTSWTYGASTPWAAGAVSIKAAPPASAITVDTTSDTVDGDTSSITALLSNKGTDGFISLREAILAANNTSGTDDIYLGAGTHTLSILGDGENLAATGDLDITESVNIHGDSASTTIIDASGMGASPDRVFDVLAGTVVNFTDLTITGGQSGGSGGGGVYIATGADLTVTNVVLENNNSNNGGAIQNDGMFTAHTTVIRNNTGNSGSGIDNSGTLVLADVAITGNNAGNAGGGLRNNGTATLTNVTLSGNSATAGAGIHNGGGSAAMTLTNVTISTNTATNSGGGIWTNQNIDATNVTITNNQATTPSTGTGGGVHIAGGGGDVTLKNSILYGNTAAIGPDADAELTSSGYNIASAAAIVEVGSDDSVSDPMLGALTGNGGFTETHALLVGSAAIDPAGLTGAPTTDQRGTTRDATPDIGAFEYVAAGNASPTIYNLAGDTLNYSEGDSVTVIEQGGNVTVGDVDSADFDAGNLTVAIITGGDSGEDVLAIRDQGVGVGNISVSGSDIRYDFGAGPVVIGTFTGGTAGADLVVTFNANANTAAADALIENITYRNTDTDNPTTSARTARFTLNDGDGGTSAAHDTTVNVATQNDAPTISNLTGDTLNYSEGDAATVIEQGGNVTVGDVDSADFDTGNLTVAITTGGDSGEDVLAIRDQGAGVGNISVSGSDVRYDFGAGPVVIGTFTGGTAGADLVVTFNANATTAAADALIENITYRNTDTDNPTTSVRTIRFTLSDGDGGTSAAHDTTVNVARINDAPTASNKTVSMDEDGVYTFSASDFNFSDVDIGDSLTQIKIKSLESVGTLKLSMFDVTDEQVISVGQIPNLTFTPVSQNHGAPYDSFAFQVYDGTEYSAATYTMTIDVDPKADTPTFNGPTNTDEDVLSTGFQLQRNAADGTEVTHFKISGITNGTLYKNDGVTVISDNSFITFAEGNAGVKFKGTSNYNGAAGFSFQASATGNNSDLSATVSAGITIDPVNDAPILGNNQLVISQGGSVVLSANALSATDVDHPDAGLTFTVSSVTGGSFERVSAPGVPVFTFNQSEVTAGDIQFIHDSSTSAPTFDVAVSDGTDSDGPDAATISFIREAVWLSTKGDESGSGTLGLTSWDKDTLLEVADPSFSLEPGVTNGSFSSVFDLTDHFGASGATELTGLHVVTRSITVGAPGNTISLQQGDVLFSVNGSQPTLTSTNSVTIDESDVVRFRPDTPGNYSTGTFEIVLDDPLLGDTNIGGISLVEETMTIGGQTLNAGNFLLVETKGTDNVIYYFDVTSAGDTTTAGTSAVFVDGTDIGIGSNDFTSVQLVANPITLGGAGLTQGQVLVSLDGDIGSGFAGIAGAVNRQDIVALTVTTAGTNTVATGTVIFEGVDIKLDASAEAIEAFSFSSAASGWVNASPTISNLAGDTLAYLPASGPLAIEFGGDATVSDVDSADFDSGSLTVSVAAGFDASEDVLAIRNQGTDPGQISVSGSNVYYNFGAGAVLIGTWSGGSGGPALVVTLNSAADAAATTALVRNITYENTDTVAPITGARTIRFALNDGDGAVSLNHDATVTVVKGAPGGVANGLTLWLKADAGVTIGLGGVSQWENQVTNATLSDLQQALSTQRPDLIASGLNFNPIISFDGIDDHLSDLSVWGADLFGSDSASLFLAGSTNGSNGVMLQWIDTLSNRVNLEDDLRFDFGDLNNDQLTAPLPSTGYHIINAQASPGTPVGLSIDIDGQLTASGSASVGSPLDNNQFGQFFLGEYPGGGFNDDLNLGEVVIYSTDLSTIDRLKVDSYLAIKYGITLGQVSPATYRDSTGTAIWNAAANSGFEHDVAGIGQDNASLLAQSQSRSINADAIVTMSGASDQNDREFMFWSNDDGALSEVAAEPAGIANRLDRIWRVSEAGDIGTTTISFDLSGLTYSGATAADFNLIVDNNTDFNLGATLVSAASYDAGTGIVTFTGVDLADGNYFSLGTSVPTNAAPTINNLAGDTLSYTEGDAATVIEQGGNVTVTDGDSANFNTGNLTVSVFAGGDNTEDVLSIRDQGPGVGNITVSGGNVLYDFGGGPVVIGTFAGGSGGANLFVTFNASATATAADALIENITYQNTDTTDPATSARTIRFTINDGDGGTSVAHDATVNVVPQNDAPVIGNLAGDTLNYTEGDAATVIEQDGNVTLTDGDSANFDTGNLTVSVFAGGDSAEDVLAIRDQGPGVGNITVSGSNVLYDFGAGPVVIGTFAGGSGGANLVVTFNASATATVADALIENITYQNTDTTNPTTSTRTIRFTLNDGDGGTSVAHDATVNVAASNAAPAIDLDTNDSSGASGADFAGTFTEGGPAVLIADAADAILTDVDTSNLTHLTVTITNLIDGASETLAADTSGTSITAAYAAGTLTLSGTDTVANYQQVLRTITYHNASSNPDGSTRVIQVVASDGGLNSSVATARIAITTVNDPPTAIDDSFSMQAGKTLTIGVGGLLANDVDLDGNSLTVIPVSGPISGTLTLAADGSFQFTPAANFSGPVTFTYAVTDGIATSAPTTVTILVAKPNNLSEVTPGDLASIAADPAPEVETVPEVPAEEENTEEDVETESATQITPVAEADVDVPPALTRGSVIQTTDDELLTLSMVPLSMPDLSDGDQDSERIARIDDGQNGYANRQTRTQSNRPNVSTLGIVKFDSKLLWGDMEGMQDDIKQSDAAPYYFAGTFAGFSGALSVGYVMWTVRGGLLATSLLAHLPAWSLVDPLLVLNELDDDDDGDDDSLEELLDKTEKEREQSTPTETASQSSASGETLT